MNYLRAREKLAEGVTITVKPRGNSMTPRLKSGDPVVLAPVTPDTTIRAGDVVFCRVRGNYYVHLVTAVRGDEVQISNNHGRVNGWASRASVFGVMVKRL